MTRTLNLLIRSQMLYPLSYERLCREMSVVGDPEMQHREIRTAWDEVCELARTTVVDRKQRWRTAVLNPYATYNYRT